ncbi:MAG: hypothetical protein JRG96_12895 [Deltaproteobacteria bacterium]|nr:hypothetical protein [Deltaproteobacteria bacterium]MBW2419715.1 hypothetical protein [Deltaproteobacteria bacterium]
MSVNAKQPMNDETKRSEAQRRSATKGRSAAALFLALPLLAIALLDLALSAHQPEATTREQALKVRPSQGRIYLLGNSIFKTGIDVESLEARLDPATGVDFEAHEGHYSSFWYLVVKNAIAPVKPHPRLLVWGFRPTYALLPSFRTRRACDIERFLGPDEEVYERLASESGDRLANPASIWLTEHSYFYSKRTELQRRLHRTLRGWGLASLYYLGDESAIALGVELARGRELGDLVHRRLAAGPLALREEGIVDAGEKFVSGPAAPFDQSFVPHIAELIEAAGIPQLVLVFKPVAQLEGGMSPEARDFAEAATRYLENRGIPHVDFVEDPELRLEHYASGDHFNAAGRRIITRRVAEALQGLLAAEGGPARVAAAPAPAAQ